MTETMNTLLIEDLKNKIHNNGHIPVKVEFRNDGKLWASRNGTSASVKVHRCFPWTEPTRFISLRDEDEKEIVLVNNVNDLDSQSQIVLQQALIEAGFIFRIKKVIVLEEDFEIRRWEVWTNQGVRRFQTRLDDWPYEVPGGGLLIRDVAGDLFFIDDPDELDDESQRLLWSFVD